MTEIAQFISNQALSEDRRSIFLIGDMNGAGKTSLMEAIGYCLYGAKADEIFRPPPLDRDSSSKSRSPIGRMRDRISLFMHPPLFPLFIGCNGSFIDRAEKFG